MSRKNTIDIYFRSSAHDDSWYADWTHDSVGSVATVRFSETLPHTASEKQLLFLANKAFLTTGYAAEYKEAAKTFIIHRDRA